MPWPLPDPAALTAQAAADIEAAFAPVEVDPRAPESVLGLIARLNAMTLFDAHLYLRALADEMFPDTAIDNLERHADVWGITRLPAVAAGGSVLFTGAPYTLVPGSSELRTAAGVSVQTTALAVVGTGGTASVAVLASVPGVAGNLLAGTVLALVSPVAGLTVQGATVEAPGLTVPSGRDRETDEALRARLLAHIRERPRGGAAADYDVWAKQVPGVEQTNVVKSWVGPGSVGVVVAMLGATVPDAGELAAVVAAIEPHRPVTADVFVVPVVPVPLGFSVYLTPDNAQTRSAVQAAADLYFATDVRIGQNFYYSRLSEALSSATGEYAHVVVGSEDGSVEIARDEIATRDPIIWAGEIGA